MSATLDWYRKNPLVHRDRRLASSPSEWVRSFSCEDLRPLIVCRGPIRKEAMERFLALGLPTTRDEEWALHQRRTAGEGSVGSRWCRNLSSVMHLTEACRIAALGSLSAHWRSRTWSVTLLDGLYSKVKPF
jgi:hypothetical protein